MKYVIVVVILLFSFSSIYAKKFDFTQIQGLSLGMKLDKALSKLKKDSIEIEISNNDDASKIYSFVPKTDIMETLTKSIKFVTKNGKISSFRLELLLDKYVQLGDKLDKLCNCKRYNEEENTFYYFFDNCTVSIDFNNSVIMILDYIGKCKG